MATATRKRRNYKQGYVRLTRKLKGRLADLAIEVYETEKETPTSESLAAALMGAKTDESSKNFRTCTYFTTNASSPQPQKGGNLAPILSQHFDGPPKQPSIFDGLPEGCDV